MPKLAHAQLMPSTYARLVLRHWAGDRVLTRELAALLPKSDKMRVADQLAQAQVLEGRLDPGWGLRLGALFDAAAHGPVGAAALSAPDLGVALDVVARYGALRTPFVTFTSSRNHAWGGLVLAADPGLRPQDVTPLIEVTLVGIQNLIRQVVGHRLDAVRVEIGWSRPAHFALFREALEGSLRFGAKRTAVLVPSSWLGTPSPFADTVAHSVALAQLAAQRARTNETPGFAAKVARLVDSQETTPSLPAVARALAVSPRTLVRRLAQEDTSFRDILDAHRRASALELLVESELDVATIAERLGYGDTANFGRACRRWFGVAPGRLRQRAAART